MQWKGIVLDEDAYADEKNEDKDDNIDDDDDDDKLGTNEVYNDNDDRRM